jgi:hypothetical protein
MNTFLLTLLIITIGVIVLHTIYFNIVCVYLHTKFQYRLFSLRDRLRDIRFQYPDFDTAAYEALELLINGYIHLLPSISARNIVIAGCCGLYSEDDWIKAKRIGETLENLSQQTDSGKCLYEIESESFDMFYRILLFNSPYFYIFTKMVVSPLKRIMPFIRNFIGRTAKTMKETASAMVVQYAREEVPVKVFGTR